MFVWRPLLHLLLVPEAWPCLVEGVQHDVLLPAAEAKACSGHGPAKKSCNPTLSIKSPLYHKDNRAEHFAHGVKQNQQFHMRHFGQRDIVEGQNVTFCRQHTLLSRPLSRVRGIR